jgi:outer membrane protein assembly factor BamB
VNGDACALPPADWPGVRASGTFSICLPSKVRFAYFPRFLPALQEPSMLKRLLACAALFLGLPFLSSGADWPGWRGPNRDAKSTETGLLSEWPEKGPRLLWNSLEANNKKGVGTGYSSVAVAHGNIYTMGDLTSTPGPKGKKGGDRECYVICLEEKTGKQLWATPISRGGGDGPRCTPVVDGDRIYALSRYGNLACLDAAKGTILWTKDYKKDFGGRMMSGWDYSESPLVDGDKLICTPGGEKAALVALNKYKGNVLWECPIPDCGGAGYASPVVAEVGGVRQYITLLGGPQKNQPHKNGGLVGVEATKGKFLWNYYRIANGTANIPTSIVKGDKVFCSTGYGVGAALLQLIPDGNGGCKAKELYFLPGNKLQNHHGGMVLLGDYIYGGHGHNQGNPFCLNMESGEFAWKPQRGPGDGSAAVVFADGNFYFRYQNGTMALVEATPSGYHLKSSFDLPSNMGIGWPHPVVANGHLYLRGQDQVLSYDVRR